MDSDTFRFRAFAGNCKKCGTFRDWPLCFEIIDGKWVGDALNERGMCRKCVEAFLTSKPCAA